MAEGKLRSVRINPDLLDRADAEATIRGLTFNAWVSMLIADALNGDVYVLVPRKRESLPERFQDRATTRPQLAQPAAAPPEDLPAKVVEAKAVVARLDELPAETAPRVRRRRRAG